MFCTGICRHVVWKFGQYSFRTRHVCQLRISVRVATTQKIIYVATRAWLATAFYVCDSSDPRSIVPQQRGNHTIIEGRRCIEQ